MAGNVAILTLADVDFKAESIKWDKRKMFYIDRSYDNENTAAKTLHVSNNITFKYIKVKLAGNY